MQRDLYPARRTWKELQAAVRERASGRCEMCNAKHGRVRKSSRTGNNYILYLHTAHRHGADPSSEDIGDLLALCPKCHMRYDRQPDEELPVSRYRQGYSVTTTEKLLDVVGGSGLNVWQGEGLNVYHWQIGRHKGMESSPLLCVGAALAKLNGLNEGEIST